ncbi:MAG: hypothetical protein K2O29_01250 [Ruminococcus sp.]|nr:hypothetical protein [Ruminococcus sp.]
MKNFRINFKLKNISDIEPWSDTIHWYALTDGTLYIQVGNRKIYEYSDFARDFFKCDIKYNDYYLERFVLDFMWIFRFIREPIPKILYENIDKFEDLTDVWKNIYENKSDDIFDEFYFGEYSSLTEWYYMQHTFDSSHLVGGQRIGFFRYGDKIKILWKSYDNAVLENDKNIWTSPNGVHEISWNDFTEEVEDFYWKFRQEMDSRTEYIYKNGLTHAQTDREILLHSNCNNLTSFRHNLDLLFSDDYEKTDFNYILALYEKMRSEINEQEL